MKPTNLASLAAAGRAARDRAGVSCAGSIGGNIFLQRVEQELAQLPFEDWAMHFLCVAGKMRYEEIAEIVTLPVEDVRRRIARVRERIRARLFAESTADELLGWPAAEKATQEPAL